jgi:hypothetical protein
MRLFNSICVCTVAHIHHHTRLPLAEQIDPSSTGILEMKNTLRLAFAVAAIAVAASGEGAFARGGPPSIMDSPGYQRRLQESRQQLPSTDAGPSSTHRHKSSHKHRHR